MVPSLQWEPPGQVGIAARRQLPASEFPPALIVNERVARGLRVVVGIAEPLLGMAIEDVIPVPPRWHGDLRYDGSHGALAARQCLNAKSETVYLCSCSHVPCLRWMVPTPLAAAPGAPGLAFRPLPASGPVSTPGCAPRRGRASCPVPADRHVRLLRSGRSTCRVDVELESVWSADRARSGTIGRPMSKGPKGQNRPQPERVRLGKLSQFEIGRLQKPTSVDTSTSGEAGLWTCTPLLQAPAILL